MAITSLNLKSVRNIIEQQLIFSPRLNQIVGSNGSGKTSLLEAISIIGRGRSFRSSQTGSVIKDGQSKLELFAQTTEGHINHKIGICKTARKTVVKLDGDNINRLSQLARITPMQILTPRSHEIIERGPEYRRRFFDWGVFHVEHKYQQAIGRYQKILAQRNSLLKKKTDFGPGWDIELAATGEQINNFRKSYFIKLSDCFNEVITSYFEPGTVSLGWKQGWDNEQMLVDVLKLNSHRDRERGFTQAGPHRADIEIRFNDQVAGNRVSRGQQKLLIFALHLAQASLIKSETEISPVILMDDLASELDNKNREKLIEGLLNINCQLFITGTELLSNYVDTQKMFHVEHGVFTEQ